MPQFFFHLRGGADGLDLDEIGVNLANAEAAYLEAFQAAQDMAREWLAKGRNPRGCVFEVVTASGELVFELPFSEALDQQAGRRPARLSHTIRTATERGARMVRLSGEVSREVQAVRETLRRSQDLLKDLKGRSG